MSAIQLAVLEGAIAVYAIDVNPAKLRQAGRLGAIPVEAAKAPERLRATGGVDVALDLVGSTEVMRSCLDSLAPLGRAVAVGLTADTFPVELTPSGIVRKPELLDHAATGRLLLDGIVQSEIPLDAAAVNSTLDELEQNGDTIRTVIRPDL